MTTDLVLASASPQAVNELGVATSPIVGKKQRKCRDILCIILSLLFIAGVIFIYIYYICVSDETKIDGNALSFKQLKDRSLLYLKPGDQLRRLCGYEREEDFLATDYSDIGKNEYRLNVIKSAFCEPSEGESWKEYSNTCLQSFKSPDFAINNMKEFKSSVFVKNESFCLDATIECADIQNKYEKVCHRDLYAIVEALNGKKKLYSNESDAVKSTSLSSEQAAALEDVLDTWPEIKSLPSQFLTKSEFSAIQQQLRKIKLSGSTTLEFLLDFCFDLPTQETLAGTAQLYVDYKELNKILSSQECIFNYSIVLEAAVDDINSVKWAGKTFRYVTNFFSNLAGSIVIELEENWGYLLIGAAMAIAISYISMFFIKFIAQIIIWVVLALILAACSLGAYSLITMGLELKDENAFREQNYGYSDSHVLQQANALVGVGSVIAAVGIIFLLLILCFFRAIRVAIAVLKVASDCMRRLFAMIFLPLVFVVLILLHLLWTICGAFMYQTLAVYDAKYNSFDFKNIVYDEQKMEYTYTYEADRLVCFAILIFMVIWGVFFIYSMIEFLISSMVTQYYFNKSKKERVLKSAVSYCIKSIGTLCVSSFITSIVVWLRWLCQYIFTRLNRNQQIKDNKVIQVTMHAAQCCLRCLQKFIEYTNRNAQIIAAISGEGYCSCCKKAMIYQFKEFKSVFVLNTLGDVFIALCKVAVAALVGVIIYFMVKGCNFGNQDMVIVPTFCSVIIAYFIAFYIFEIFELVVDSIFLSYVYENENMKSQREAGVESYAPKELQDLLQGKVSSSGCCRGKKARVD